jgi:PPK2 family polyphosphate:nucleotide phosphotransferase
MNFKDSTEKFIVTPGKKVSLKRDFDPSFKPADLDKETAKQLLDENLAKLTEYQAKLYAQNKYAVLVIIQALDAAGKDGTIKHVMSGVNPQGCHVRSFKPPSHEELDHDYLWRCVKALPERGQIGLFNRSYYEEVLVARVHPEVLAKQQLPPRDKSSSIWKERFEEINNFEKYLVNNGTLVLKFFLYVSKDEQKKRLLERIEMPEKNWKFSLQDIEERQFWNDYMEAYEDCFNQTSTNWAPWYVIPADYKPFTRLAVGTIICQALKSLKLSYPTLSKDQQAILLKAKDRL